MGGEEKERLAARWRTCSRTSRFVTVIFSSQPYSHRLREKCTAEKRATDDRHAVRAKLLGQFLPAALIPHVRGMRAAIVDDAVSAGSSVRATKDALDMAGATTVVIGTLLTLGNTAIDHFAQMGIPVEAVEHRRFEMWRPDECPLCLDGEPCVDPRSPA